MNRQVLLALLFLGLVLSVIAPAPTRGEMGPFAFAVATILQFLLFPPIFVGTVLVLSDLPFRAGRIRVWEPLVTLSTTVLVSQTGRVVGSLLDGALVLTRPGVLLDVAVHYAIWQALVIVFFVFVVPSQRKRQQIAEAQAKQAPGMFHLGRLTLDPDCIRHIEADDHYLVIRAGAVEMRVPGRLTDALSQLGSRGMAVHRSHWLAYGEFGPVVRHGRTFQMLTQSGRRVPVSREKWREVRDLAKGRGEAA